MPLTYNAFEASAEVGSQKFVNSMFENSIFENCENLGEKSLQDNIVLPLLVGENESYKNPIVNLFNFAKINFNSSIENFKKISLDSEFNFKTFHLEENKKFPLYKNNSSPTNKLKLVENIFDHFENLEEIMSQKKCCILPLFKSKVLIDKNNIFDNLNFENFDSLKQLLKFYALLRHSMSSNHLTIIYNMHFIPGFPF